MRKAVRECGGIPELRCEELSDRYEFTAEVILPVKSEQNYS